MLWVGTGEDFRLNLIWKSLLWAIQKCMFHDWSPKLGSIFPHQAVLYTTDQNSSTPALQWYAIRTYFRCKNIPKFWTEFVKLDVKLKARMFYIMYQVFSHQSCSCNEKFEVKDTWSMTFFTTERRRALHKNTPDLLHKSWHFSITDLFW